MHTNQDEDEDEPNHNPEFRRMGDLVDCMELRDSEGHLISKNPGFVSTYSLQDLRTMLSFMGLD